jgi:predicted nucleic acid-binding protein
VFIPRAVADEVAAPDVNNPVRLTAFPWLTIREVTSVPEAAAAGLDPGEAEAIALAAELKASTLVMDERKGRARATQLGLPVTGTLAVVVQAKRLKLIPSARSVMNELTASGFRAAPALVAAMLVQAEE